MSHPVHLGVSIVISGFYLKMTFFTYWTKVQYTNVMDPCMVFLNLCS